MEKRYQGCGDDRPDNPHPGSALLAVEMVQDHDHRREHHEQREVGRLLRQAQLGRKRHHIPTRDERRRQSHRRVGQRSAKRIGGDRDEQRKGRRQVLVVKGRVAAGDSHRAGLDRVHDRECVPGVRMPVAVRRDAGDADTGKREQLADQPGMEQRVAPDRGHVARRDPGEQKGAREHARRLPGDLLRQRPRVPRHRQRRRDEHDHDDPPERRVHDQPEGERDRPRGQPDQGDQAEQLRRRDARPHTRDGRQGEARQPQRDDRREHQSKLARELEHQPAEHARDDQAAEPPRQRSRRDTHQAESPGLCWGGFDCGFLHQERIGRRLVGGAARQILSGRSADMCQQIA